MRHTRNFVFIDDMMNSLRRKATTFSKKSMKKKFVKPYYQNKLSNEFKIYVKQLWKSIYEGKLIKIEDTTLADVNYRLLNNINVIMHT